MKILLQVFFLKCNSCPYCEHELFVQKDKVPQDDELITKAMYPKREEFQWRPAPILCKRFDLIDPYMGKVLYLLLSC